MYGIVRGCTDRDAMVFSCLPAQLSQTYIILDNRYLKIATVKLI